MSIPIYYICIYMAKRLYGPAMAANAALRAPLEAKHICTCKCSGWMKAWWEWGGSHHLWGQWVFNHSYG